MTLFKKLSFLSLLLIVLASCEESIEPIGSCEGAIWVNAIKNGDDICLGTVNIIYWRANTEGANIALTAGTTDKVGISEIDASFKIPIAGISINTPYPLIEGRIAAADRFTEGSLTFINYSTACMAGTFELKAVDTLAGITQTYTNGRFVINGAGSQDNSCNPFN